MVYRFIAAVGNPSSRRCRTFSRKGSSLNNLLTLQPPPHPSIADAMSTFSREGRRQVSEAQLDVEVRHVQGVFADEIASWLHHVAHEFGEDVVGFVEFGDFYPRKRADV